MDSSDDDLDLLSNKHFVKSAPAPKKKAGLVPKPPANEKRARKSVAPAENIVKRPVQKKKKTEKIEKENIASDQNKGSTKKPAKSTEPVSPKSIQVSDVLASPPRSTAVPNFPAPPAITLDMSREHIITLYNQLSSHSSFLTGQIARLQSWTEVNAQKRVEELKIANELDQKEWEKENQALKQKINDLEKKVKEIEKIQKDQDQHHKEHEKKVNALETQKQKLEEKITKLQSDKSENTEKNMAELKEKLELSNEQLKHSQSTQDALSSELKAAKLDLVTMREKINSSGRLLGLYEKFMGLKLLSQSETSILDDEELEIPATQYDFEHSGRNGSVQYSIIEPISTKETGKFYVYRPITTPEEIEGMGLPELFGDEIDFDENMVGMFMLKISDYLQRQKN